jgi:hypothetical protein
MTRAAKARRWKARSRCGPRVNVPRRLVERARLRVPRMPVRDRTRRGAKLRRRVQRRSGVIGRGPRTTRTGIGARPRRERRRRARLPRARVVRSRRGRRPKRSRLPRRVLPPSPHQLRRRPRSRRNRPRTKATGRGQRVERSGFQVRSAFAWGRSIQPADYYSVASVRWRHCPSPISHFPSDR